MRKRKSPSPSLASNSEGNSSAAEKKTRSYVLLATRDNAKDFKAATRSVRGLLSSDLCGINVDEEYAISHFLPNADAVAVSYTVTTRGRTTRVDATGFALIHFATGHDERPEEEEDNDRDSTRADEREGKGEATYHHHDNEVDDEAKDWHIDLICAAGSGTAILGHVFEQATNLGVRSITLHALPNVINYYSTLR